MSSDPSSDPSEILRESETLLEETTTTVNPMESPEAVAALRAELAAAREILRRRQEIQDLKDQLAAIHSTSVTASVGTNAESVTSFASMIGNFAESDRSEIELEHGSLQIISSIERQKLNASDKNRVYTTFVKGIPNKFKGIATIVGLDKIASIENLMSFAQLRSEMQKHIYSVSAHSVFLILCFDTSGRRIDPDSKQGKPINILSATSLPSLAEVEQSTFHHFKQGTNFNQENLLWSFEAIRNSCDKELQNILDAKMLRYRDNQRFCPLYFYELVSQNVDSKAVRTITSLTVPSQDGQSIARIAKIFRSTINCSKWCTCFPPTWTPLLLKSTRLALFPIFNCS